MSKMADKRVLVLRDGTRPELTYAFLGFTIFLWLWTLGAYLVTRDLTEPIVMRNTILHSYYTINSESYLIFLILVIIFSIVSICCFRITKVMESN